MAKWIVGGLLTAAITFIINLVIYLGVFKEVQIELVQKGPYKMIYKDHVGPYHKIVSTLEEVEKWVKNNGESCQYSFGEFLDNPDEVEHERLRSKGGCIISDTFLSTNFKLPEGFKLQTLEQQKFVRGYFTGSPAIGPFKVYPKIIDFIQKNNLTQKGSTYEIYEVISPKQMNTEYLFSVE